MHNFLQLEIRVFFHFLFTILILTNHSFAQNFNFSEDYLKSNLEFLADDLLEGREAASRGEQLASLFIASELKKYDVKPFGDNGTYFQNFKLNTIGFSKASTVDLFVDNKKTITDFLGENFIIPNRSKIDTAKLNKSYKMVFAGYGLVIPEYNINDYETIDVKDKVIVILSGENLRKNPRFEGVDFPKGFESRNQKIQNALENGAAGIVMIASERIEKYWDYYSSNADAASYRLPDSTSERKNSIPEIIITEKLAIELFDNEKLNLTQIMKLISENKDFTKFELSKNIKFNFVLKDSTVIARNVVGIVEGNSPELKHEIVSLGAHYDHIGTRNGEVYNGADDNASGTVTMLEVIRAIAEKRGNNRSIMVVFHSAEEKGLLGAKYFTENFENISDVVVNINIDMVGRESSDSLHCIGSDKLSTELDKIVRHANQQSSEFILDYSFNDPNDPQRLYYRSDHVHYARKNIPIVFFYDNMQEDYHRSSDDAHKINFEKILKVCNLVYQIASDVANLENRLIVDKKYE